MGKISWIHLSDLHFGEGSGSFRAINDIIHDNLLDDIKELIKRLGQPNFLYITGDTAFSGKKEQFKRAEEWIRQFAEITKISTANIFVVPGNHDIDRGKTEEAGISALHQKMRSNPVMIDDVIAEKDPFEKYIWPKFVDYSDFIKDSKFGVPEISASSPYWIKNIVHGGLPIVIIGLNTCFLSFDDKDAPENMILGNIQLLNTVLKSDEKSLLIVLQHHPPNWISDGESLLAHVSKKAHLIFSGHVHQPGGGIYNPFIGRGNIIFTAGAVSTGTKEPKDHTYSWGIVDHEGLSFFPRQWVPEQKIFCPDKRFLLAEDAVRCPFGNLPKTTGQLLESHFRKNGFAKKSKDIQHKTLKSIGPIYFAAPHRNSGRNRSVKLELSKAKIELLLPQDMVLDEVKKGKEKTPQMIRSTCIEAINKSKLVVVDLDRYGLDTAWEMGFAEGLGIPIIGVGMDEGFVGNDRLVKIPLYDLNFMHGWKTQEIIEKIEVIEERCKDKTTYVCGSFGNVKALDIIRGSNLVKASKKLIIPKDYLDINLDKTFPYYYKAKTREAAISLLEDADIAIVVLPRYGMDTSWQIGYATAMKKEIIGWEYEDTKVSEEISPIWNHWMHGWRDKITVSGLNLLAAVIVGMAHTKIIK